MKTKFNIYKLFLLTLFFGVLFCTQLFAQQPGFSGTWKLTEKTNLSGADYSNAVPAQIKLEQSITELTEGRTEVSPDENTPGTTSTEKLPLETGKGTIGTTADKRKIKTTVQINGKVLTETNVITLPNSTDTAIKIKEVSTVSDDGKTLTLVKEFENLKDPNDKWSAKGIYERQ